MRVCKINHITKVLDLRRQILLIWDAMCSCLFTIYFKPLNYALIICQTWRWFGMRFDQLKYKLRLGFEIFTNLYIHKSFIQRNIRRRNLQSKAYIRVNDTLLLITLREWQQPANYLFNVVSPHVGYVLYTVCKPFFFFFKFQKILNYSIDVKNWKSK